MESRKKERNKTQEKQVMHNKVSHNHSIPEQQSVAPGQHPPAYTLTFYCMEYPFVQFRSVLLSGLPPAFLYISSLAKHETLKSPQLCYLAMTKT